VLRALALVLSVLLVGSHVLTAVHTALVPHEVCSEHGELVHADHHGELKEPAPAADPGSPAASPRAASEHSHDHCSVVSRPAEEARVLPSTPAVVLTAFPLAEPRALVALLAAPASAPLLSAPKQSPPA
jgi:hypothetical protein